jgi:hypothetical protein
LDGNIYWALQEDGTTISARLGADKKYHMDGDLISISKSAQHSLFKNLKSILEAINGKDFLVGGCCSDEEHMANRRLPGFE